MKLLRANIICRIFCFLMVIQISNLSAVTKDVTDFFAEDLNLNDQEPDTESLLEEVKLNSYYSKKSYFTSQIIEIKPFINFVKFYYQSPVFDIFSPPPNI